MNIFQICILMYTLSAILGICVGLLKAHHLKNNFPEFFSPFLNDTNEEFVNISKDIKITNAISDEELTESRFIQLKY